MHRFRAVREGDWPEIALLASNEVQEADHSGLEDLWLHSRRSFDGLRRHAVLELHGAIVGYCAIERREEDALDTYRIFLVASWDPENSEVHEELFARVEAMLREVGARRAWMRELRGDLELIRFVGSRGFEVSAPYRVADKEMLILTKPYPVRGRGS
ncbi:MAG: hypothetical protein CL910_13430 [Deltaproteobacteria bacterium]|nr:hypothetical protein [Deltaproteobacteria bacterium]